MICSSVNLDFRIVLVLSRGTQRSEILKLESVQFFWGWSPPLTCEPICPRWSRKSPGQRRSHRR